MKKIGLLILTLIFCLSANGIIFADGVLVGDYTGGGDDQPCSSADAAKDGVLISDFTGVLVSDLVSGATAGATGILIVGRSGVLISDFTGETPSCSE